jgi:DNA-binding beta-propeller fold protein YncE
VSVLTISGKTVTAAGKLDFGAKASGPASVAFAPDGKTALVARDGDHKISVLSIDGTKVEDTKRMLTGGIRPYPIQISPKGDVAVVGNQGGGAGDIDTINVIDLKGKAPRIVHTIDVGQIVEAVAFSDDGAFVAVTAQDGSNRAPNHPFYNAQGLAAVFSVSGTTLTKVAEARIGKWNQGIAWSRDGKTLLAQNMVEKSLSVLSFDGKTLTVTGEIKVNGGPEGLRTAER